MIIDTRKRLQVHSNMARVIAIMAKGARAWGRKNASIVTNVVQQLKNLSVRG